MAKGRSSQRSGHCQTLHVLVGYVRSKDFILYRWKVAEGFF